MDGSELLWRNVQHANEAGTSAKGVSAQKQSSRFTVNVYSEHSFSYGIYLAQNLSRLVIKRGYKPFVVIRHENEASKSLYKKLGFEREFVVARIVFTPFGDPDENKNDADGETAHENGKENGKENGNHVNCHNGVNNHKA